MTHVVRIACLAVALAATSALIGCQKARQAAPKGAGRGAAKKVYRLVHDRGYALGFIGGGVRGLQHFTEMVGGDVCITMNWGGQAEELLKLGQPVVARLFNPVQDHVLDELLTRVPAFRQAYMEDGLQVDEYEEYGPVRYFRNMFIEAWRNTLKLIAERRTSR